MDDPELVQHLAQVTSGSPQVCARIEPVANTKLARCFRHQLSEPSRTGTADCERIVAGFGPDQRIQKAGGQPILGFCRVDVRKIGRATETRFHRP